MPVNDLIGAAGVAVLLLAFVLNVFNKIAKDGLAYIIMNITGASLACVASYLINYLPFIILEACWTIASCFALIKFLKNKKII